MKRIQAGILIMMGAAVAACGEAATSPAGLSLESVPEELVSQSMVDEATSLTDRADYRTDVASSDRVCDISDRTVAAGRALTVSAGELTTHLVDNYPETASARLAPGFEGATEALYETLVGPVSCRTVVGAFIETAGAGLLLGRAIVREELLRRDDVLGKIVRNAADDFITLRQHLREDLGNQVTDRPVSDQP